MEILFNTWVLVIQVLLLSTADVWAVEAIEVHMKSNNSGQISDNCSIFLKTIDPKNDFENNLKKTLCKVFDNLNSLLADMGSRSLYSGGMRDDGSFISRYSKIEAISNGTDRLSDGKLKGIEWGFINNHSDNNTKISLNSNSFKTNRTTNENSFHLTADSPSIPTVTNIKIENLVPSKAFNDTSKTLVKRMIEDRVTDSLNSESKIKRSSADRFTYNLVNHSPLHHTINGGSSKIIHDAEQHKSTDKFVDYSPFINQISGETTTIIHDAENKTTTNKLVDYSPLVHNINGESTKIIHDSEQHISTNKFIDYSPLIYKINGDSTTIVHETDRYNGTHNIVRYSPSNYTVNGQSSKIIDENDQHNSTHQFTILDERISEMIIGNSSKKIGKSRFIEEVNDGNITLDMVLSSRDVILTRIDTSTKRMIDSSMDFKNIQSSIVKIIRSIDSKILSIGIVLTSKYILTSASSLYKWNGLRYELSELKVKPLSSQTGKTERESTVEKIYIPSDFTFIENEYMQDDLAILEVQGSFTQTTLDLAGETNTSLPQGCFALGYDSQRINVGETDSLEMMRVNLSSSIKCKNEIPEFNDQSSYCFTNETEINGNSHLYSGSPLICSGKLFGISCWNGSVGSLDKIVVYSRLDHHTKFIWYFVDSCLGECKANDDNRSSQVKQYKWIKSFESTGALFRPNDLLVLLVIAPAVVSVLRIIPL